MPQRYREWLERYPPRSEVLGSPSNMSWYPDHSLLSAADLKSGYKPAMALALAYEPPPMMTTNRPVTTGSAERLIRKTHLARELGVSHAAISKACRDGRLTPALRQHNGHEVLAYGPARRLWAQCRPEPLPQALPELVEPDLPELAAAIAEGLPPIAESRARRMHYLAERDRIELQQLKGELVSAAEVREAAFKQGREVRDALMALPSRLASPLAVMTDPREVHQLLSEAIRVELTRLAGPR